MSLKKRLSFKRTWNFNSVSKVLGASSLSSFCCLFFSLSFSLSTPPLINHGHQLLWTAVWSGWDLRLFLFLEHYWVQSFDIFSLPSFNLCDWWKVFRQGTFGSEFGGTSPCELKQMKEITVNVLFAEWIFKPRIDAIEEQLRVSGFITKARLTFTLTEG